MLPIIKQSCQLTHEKVVLLEIIHLPRNHNLKDIFLVGFSFS